MILAPRPVQGPAPGPDPCTVGQPCELVGRLTLERRAGDNSWATLAQEGACIPLLLPSRVYADWKRWNGKRVRVEGAALARGPALPEVLLLRYRDRWLSPSICSESRQLLYVDTIARAD